MTIELWSVDLDAVARRPDLLDLASSSDLAASDRLSTETLRRRFVARRAVTRHILGCQLGVAPATLQIIRRCSRCGSHDHGRPEVIGASAEFSVSTCGGLALVAIADARIGVDIELDDALQSSRADLPRAVLAPRERTLLDSLPPGERPRASLRMWVAKEAVLKADGRGLSVDPRRVDTSAVVTDGIDDISLDGTVWTVQSVTTALSAAADVLAAVAEVRSARSPSALATRRVEFYSVCPETPLAGHSVTPEAKSEPQPADGFAED